MEPIRIALGQWLARWYTDVAPLTPALQEYTQRENIAKAIAMVPARMIDEAMSMLELWQRNDTNDGPTTPAKLPMVLVAMATKEVSPTGRERQHNVSDPVSIIMPLDSQERVFELRTFGRNYRVQLVFADSDSTSAASLAAQFMLWVESPSRQTFNANWRFAGVDSHWPVQLETSDLAAMEIKTGVKNLTLLALDLTLCATEPIFRAPGAREAYREGVDVGVHGQDAGSGYEGNGPGAETHSPHGFPLVERVDIDQHEAGPFAGETHIAAHVVEETGITSREMGLHDE